jgi:hypothetical protein
VVQNLVAIDHNPFSRWEDWKVMTRKYRAWFGPLAVALTLALFAVPTRAADHTKYLPNDTAAYLNVNFRLILDSKLVPKDALAALKAELDKHDEVKKVLNSLGFDPFKDLDALTVAASAFDAEKVMAILTGRFNADKIYKVAAEFAKKNEDALKITKLGDQKLIEFTPENSPNTIYAVVVDKYTILASTNKEMIKDGLAKAAKKKTTELKKEVAAFLKKVNKKDGLTFMIRGDLIAQASANAPIPGQQAEMVKTVLDQLELISGGVTLADNVILHLGITTKDKGTAALLALGLAAGLKQAPQAIDKLAENMEQLAPFKEMIKDFVKAIKVKKNENTVTLHATLTKELIEKLGKELKKAKEKNDQ